MLIMSLMQSIRVRCKRMAQNYVTRRQLALLDERMLKDIGCSRADALHEMRKPFWRD